MNNGNTQMSRVEKIENKLDRPTIGTIGLSAQRGMAVDSMGQALEVAKLMAVSGCAVPRHLRENPGACLAIAVQGWEWGINPFAIANKSYEVNDRLGYESALYQAVLTRRAPIKGRIKMEYSGNNGTRVCKVWAELTEGGIVDYVSPQIQNIKPQNSPLWKNDPDQQLFYFSVRSFARRHFADVMMGISTADELIDAAPVMAEPVQRGVAGVLAKVTARQPAVEGKVIETGQPEPTDQAADLRQQVEDAELPTDIAGDAEPDVSGADAEEAGDGEKTETRPVQTFTFPDPCTEAQIIGFAKACAPEGMSPDDAEKSFKAWLKLNTDKAWMKLSRDEQRRVFNVVTGGDSWL